MATATDWPPPATQRLSPGTQRIRSSPSTPAVPTSIEVSEPWLTSINVSIKKPTGPGQQPRSGDLVSLAVAGGAGKLHAQVAQLRAQGLPGDAQQEGGPVLISARVLQDAGK